MTAENKPTDTIEQVNKVEKVESTETKTIEEPRTIMTEGGIKLIVMEDQGSGYAG